MNDFLTLEDGLARGFHAGYEVLAQGCWEWTGNGWRRKAQPEPSLAGRLTGGDCQSKTLCIADLPPWP